MSQDPERERGVTSSPSSGAPSPSAAEGLPKLPRQGSAPWRIIEHLQDVRVPQRPKAIADALGLSPAAVRQAVRRLLRAGLLVQPMKGYYVWHAVYFEDSLSRYEGFLDPSRPLCVHGLQATGKVAGLYQIIAKTQLGWWHQAFLKHTPYWTRVYLFDDPAESKCTISVYTTDTVTIDVSSISDHPWTLDQYVSFHDQVNGIFKELTNEPAAFDQFSFTRLDFNQDFPNTFFLGPYTQVKVFRDMALAVYQKGDRMRKEIQFRGKPGVPTTDLKTVRAIGSLDMLAQLFRHQDSLQTQNLLAGIANFFWQYQKLIKGHIRTLFYSHDRLHQSVRAFATTTFKDELAACINQLSDDVQHLSEDLGGGVLTLTQFLTQKAQETDVILRHLHDHSHEFEENVGGRIEDLKERQEYGLSLLSGLHRSMKTQQRGENTRQDIVFALASHPDGLTIKDLIKITGRCRSTIDRHLTILLTEVETKSKFEKVGKRPAIYRLKRGGLTID